MAIIMRASTMLTMLGLLPTFQRRLVNWYRAARRDLPWRTERQEKSKLPDPYRVLVSETMLQQTQVATVIPYFQRFVDRFPTVHALAQADEQEVLQLWQGLGYYSRARKLRLAAQMIVQQYNGRVPDQIEQLLLVPGVGRYTAGAIVSIGYDQPAPIVDGNVIRVISRLDLIRTNARDDPGALKQIWLRAEAVVPRRNCADFNSGLMELGATICLRRNPRCAICPVRAHCQALATGQQDAVPPVRKKKILEKQRRWVLCIERDKRYLIQQRPARGRWASMWQFLTVTPGTEESTTDDITPALAVMNRLAGLKLRSLRLLSRFDHRLTHRHYTFTAYHCRLAKKARLGATQWQRWVSLEELEQYPLPQPHRNIAQLLPSAAEDGSA